MAKSTRRPQQFYAIVMWALSIVFAAFLIGLGSLIIRDIPRVDQNVTVEQFIDQDTLAALQGEEQQLESRTTRFQRHLEDKGSIQSSLQSEYDTARNNFQNWIATRTATQAAATNPDVLARTQVLEELTTRLQDAERDVTQARSALTEQRRALSDVRTNIQGLREEAAPDYRRAKRMQELRVFAFRLMVTLPLLIMAGWMLVRKRRSAYWPLYRGFVLFAGFAFFVELVPYLPSYGGYVRYSVGILLVIVCGYVLIKQMRLYLARKQAEEARTEAERRKSIDYETALKKIAAKTCPGCDRAIVFREGVNSDFCVHCGIHLQRECGTCQTRNVTFHRYCLSCGIPNSDGVNAELQSR